MTTFATIHEYRSISDKVAKITASITGSRNGDDILDAISAAMKSKATPINASFRWFDEETKSAVVGFVYANTATQYLPEGKVDASTYKVMASNLYMHASDESLWEMKEGAGGKYLARQGTDDLSSTLEQARRSPRGAQPRMSNVLQASVKTHELVAFVNEGRRAAEVDYGICLGSSEKAMTVLSHLTNQTMTVKHDSVIAAYQLDRKHIPKVPGEVKARILKASNLQRAANEDQRFQLTPEEYWRALYGNYSSDNRDGSPSDYLNLVLDQVRSMAAA